MVPVVPALVQLKVRKNPFAKAAGVRTDASVTAICDGKAIASDRGELQLTAYGISGIPVFQISRYVAKALYLKQNAKVKIDFLPEMSENVRMRSDCNYIRPVSSIIGTSVYTTEVITHTVISFDMSCAFCPVRIADFSFDLSPSMTA